MTTTAPYWTHNTLRPELGHRITAEDLAAHLVDWVAYMEVVYEHSQYAVASEARSLRLWDTAHEQGRAAADELGRQFQADPLPRPRALPAQPLLFGRWLPPELAVRAALYLGLPTPPHTPSVRTPTEQAMRNYQHVETWPFPDWYNAPPHAARFKSRTYQGFPVVLTLTNDDWLWNPWRLVERPAKYWSEVGDGPALRGYQKRARLPTPPSADTFAIFRWELA